MTPHQLMLAEIVRKDERYAPEAYEFVFDGLSHTQMLLGRVPTKDAGEKGQQQCHVSGQELVRGLCDLAKRQFGLMARVVFHLWGINRTADFGEIIFNLIGAELLSKTDSDRREDFHDVLDLDRELRDSYAFEVGDGWQSVRRGEL
jgi:uncharacterized repeat protein (TIGR04138 family)